MPKKVDMLKKSFDRLKVKKEYGRDKHGNVLWKCKCDCGNIKIINGSSLRRGLTKSCGCLNKEINRERVKQISNVTHGMTKTPTYRIWLYMKQRCTNPNNDKYNDYGGRGITVCKEWENSFISFYKDMGPRPQGLSIERQNNELGYFKENCCWADRTTQARNHRVHKDNTTGVPGIAWNKNRQKYIARITVSGKTLYIGCFKTLEKASIARKQAEQKYWGKDASI